MAISGSSASSVALWMENGKLREGAIINRGSDVIEQSAQCAIKRILAGERVNLWLHGHNLAVVRAALSEEIK